MSQKIYTRKQVADDGSKQNALFIIDNVVYNVTPFLDEHPGGHEVLVNVVGKDASEEFEDIGHSLDAKELMKKYAVGEVPEEERVQVTRRQVSWGADSAEPALDAGLFSSWKLPVLLGILATLLYSYLLG